MGREPRRFRNKLLSRLPHADLDAIVSKLELVALELGQVLETPHEPISHVYFPENAIASVIATSGPKRRTEAGPFGREGMSGLPIIMSSDRSPHETQVQVPGSAYRIEAGELQAMLAEHPAIRSLFTRYAHAFSIQTAHTLLAAASVVVETRLARWILMLHDRVDGDEMVITHDFIALMLSVRRPGVTVALHVLEGNGWIRSVRGRLTVRDRAGLEKMCGPLYGVPEVEYQRLIGISLSAS